MKMLVKVLCFLVFVSQWVLIDNQLAIGGIFYKNEALELKAALDLAVREMNFTASVKEVSMRGEILEISGHVCALASEGVIGIIDGTGGRASEHIQALCDTLELPHIIVQPYDLAARDWSLLDLHPSADAYNLAIKSLITEKEWNNFTILYVKGHSVSRVQQLMEMGNITDKYTISLRELSGDDYRDVLTNAKDHGYVNFVVDCPSKVLEQLLIQAQQVGLMADEHSYIFVSPDLFTLDLTRYRYGGVNMTGFRLVPLQDSKAQALWEFTKQFNEETGLALEPEAIKTKVLLIYDAVKVFYAAKETLLELSTDNLDCEKDHTWSYGSSLLNFMKTNKVTGLTRSLIFDGLGQRTDVTFDVLELTPAGNQSIGKWESNKLKMDRPFVPPVDVPEDSIMMNKTFKVLISKTPPYGYMTDSSEKLQGNDRFEGFTVDLIKMLAEILSFNYEFEIENDYGSIDEKTGKWTGMSLKLIEEKADFALCDLTITAVRQSGIDFSTPFMTTGIGILYKQPSKQPPEMFSFMAVFSKEVWYYMMFMQMGVGVVMIIVGRISNKEWQNPVPCIEQPEELSNQFSFANSVWLIIGSVMQQGSEIAPIALAPRLVTSIWWFFTMVMVASYVGTLVAVLTVEKNVLPFNSVEELYNLKSAKYGAKNKGSTIQFFKDSSNDMYKKMYQRMVDNHWLVSDNEDGVAMAENSTYAFFMEESSIEYYRARHCDLIKVGKLLDSKSYGIGMKKGSEYKKFIDDALLKLKERGIIQKLRTLWWHEKKEGGKCGVKSTEETKQLGMKNMLGAFVVLGAGSLLGVFISIFDMLWGVFKRSVKYSTTFKHELVEELKFALRFSGDIKPIKRPQKSDDGSGEALAEADAEAKDDLGSLRSALTPRSGHSGSTHRSHHSHGSRHSASGLSVAFARRREYT